jgi:hypothetical protein
MHVTRSDAQDGDGSRSVRAQYKVGFTEELAALVGSKGSSRESELESNFQI